MALESWEWFVRLMEKGSFTHAAEELQMPQQTLSSRLAALERELKCKLVVRSTPLGLTRAGEAFLRYAREQQQMRSQLLRQVGEVTVGGSGVLKVGISSMRGCVLMPHVLEQFHRSLPGVRVNLLEGTNEELVRLVERNEVDMAVAHFDEAHPGVRVRPLFREQVVLAISSDLLERMTGLPAETAVQRVQDEGLGLLRDCPFLLETADDISGRIARVELRRAGIKADGLVESESMITLLSLCARGLGGVFCPTNILSETDRLTGGLLRIGLSSAASYAISVGTPESAEAWMPVQMLEDVMGALFGEGGTLLRP